MYWSKCSVDTEFLAVSKLSIIKHPCNSQQSCALFTFWQFSHAVLAFYIGASLLVAIVYNILDSPVNCFCILVYLVLCLWFWESR